MGIAHSSAQFGSIPLYRRIARRCLQLIRPLALPFLFRLKRWISLGVDESRSVQSLQHLLTRQNDVSVRLDRIEVGLESLQLVIQQAPNDLLLEQRACSARLEEVSASLQSLQLTVREQASFVTQLLSVQRDSNGRLEALSQTADKLSQGLSETRELSARGVEYAGKLLQSRALPLGDEVLARSPFGWLLLPSEDLPLVQAMIETGGLLEPGTAAVVQALLEPNEFAIDVGAHVGTLSLAMALSVAPSGRVLAIEPTPRTAALLRRTCALAGLEHIIQIEECAAGAEDGRAVLSFGATSGHNSLLGLAKTTGSVDVEVRSLDAIVPRGTAPALVKMDAEGTELDIWRGMERLVREAPNMAVIVEFWYPHLQRSGVTIESWLSVLTASGFVPWEIDEASGAIRPLRSHGLENVVSMNVLLLRHPPSHWPRLRIAT